MYDVVFICDMAYLHNFLSVATLKHIFYYFFTIIATDSDAVSFLLINELFFCSFAARKISRNYKMIDDKKKPYSNMSNICRRSSQSVMLRNHIVLWPRKKSRQCGNDSLSNAFKMTRCRCFYISFIRCTCNNIIYSYFYFFFCTTNDKSTCHAWF